MNDKKEDFYTFKPRVHRHNDPNEYSKQSPRRFPREDSELCTDGFDEKIELEMDKNENNYFKPWVHRHNDPSEYSPRSPRRHAPGIGKLYKNVFSEDKDTLEPSKVNFDFQFGGYKQCNEQQEPPKQKTLKKKY